MFKYWLRTTINGLNNVEKINFIDYSDAYGYLTSKLSRHYGMNWQETSKNSGEFAATDGKKWYTVAKIYQIGAK